MSGKSGAGVSSSSPSEARDNLESIQYARVIDLISEGEIEGLVGTFASDIVPGITRGKLDAAGFVEDTSIYNVRMACIRMMSIPGVYSLQIRNVKGGEWMHYGPIDTRNPNVASEAVSKAKKKAKK
jgi:hypothetical protein